MATYVYPATADLRTVDHPDCSYFMLSPMSSVFASTRSELVAEILPGYPTEAEAMVERFDCRQRYLHSLARISAHNAYNEVITTTEVKTTDFTSDELDLMLNADRAQVYSGNWAHPVPLFLMATSFKPYTDIDPPTGNVWLLDPGNEATFLDTLVEAGLIHLFRRDDTEIKAT